MCVAVEKKKNKEKRAKGKQIRTKRQVDTEHERRTQRQKSTEIIGREKKKDFSMRTAPRSPHNEYN